MANATFEAVKSMVAKLTPEERGKLVQWCKALGTEAVVADDDWILEAIGRALKKRGLPASTGAAKFITTYPEKSLAVQMFLIEALGEEFEITALVKQQLGDLAIGALIKYIERIPDLAGRGLQPSLIMNCVHLIPQAIDRELPGYLANGMIAMVLACEVLGGTR